MIFERLCLASQSPRRREMIGWLNVPFRITRPDVDEVAFATKHVQSGDVPNSLSPQMLVARLASLKARSVRNVAVGEWILAADTLVELDGQPLGKPQDAAEAYEMLERLRGRVHHVHTGVTLRWGNSLLQHSEGVMERESVCQVTTRVWMREYADAEIAAYVSSGDPLDKAGAYAIQHTGFDPVARLAHCYTNVVGLPLCGVLNLLRSQGIIIAVDVPALCYDHFGYHCQEIDKGTVL